jgi:hypothetical protein
METNLRRAATVDHRLIAALAAEPSPAALGGTSLADMLSTALRISRKKPTGASNTPSCSARAPR